MSGLFEQLRAEALERLRDQGPQPHLVSRDIRPNGMVVWTWAESSPQAGRAAVMMRELDRHI